MSKINEYCGKEKLAILKELETGQGSLSRKAYKFSINVSILKEWRRRYEVYGVRGLEFRSGNKSYRAETKLQAVQDYLSGKYSQNELADVSDRGFQYTSWGFKRRLEAHEMAQSIRGREKWKSIDNGPMEAQAKAA